MINLLLVFVPIAVALEALAPERHRLVFFAAALATLPLARWMARSTEHLSVRLGAGVGGFLSATFGNAAEMIIAFAALRAGLHELVKASIAGSIIANSLFILGAAMLGGGLRHKEQLFNAVAARSQATLLTLAAISMILVGGYRAALGDRAAEVGPLSVWIAIVLLGVYALYLYFSLGTHASLFTGSGHGDEEHGEAWSTGKAAAVLGAATACIALVSEILVGAIEPTAKSFGLGEAFVGVFVVAILGTAAEQATVIGAALRNRIDLSLSIAIGSGVQVALFVAPMMVLLSQVAGPRPMDLAFDGGLILSVLLAVWVTGQVAGDGRSDWMKGVSLLAVYALLGLTFFFAPVAPPPAAP